MPNFLAFILLTTIAGWGDPFAPSPPAPAPKYYTQTLQLHPGWNLVSWHIEPLEPDIYLPQILPMWIYNPPDPPVPTWFNSKGGNLYKWDNNVNFWPQQVYQTLVW
ncbi:MAG TPA: hypothetical protein VF398_07755, partial [bacterium]